MGEPKHLKLTRTGSVATVTMARPEVHNAFNEALIAELHAAFTELGADDAVRVVVLAGEGKSFCVGADLTWMKRMSEASEAENRTDAERLAAMLRSVAECPKPVVARVHGGSLGGGSGLTAAVDVAIAGESAFFGFSEVRFGLAPATIGPYVIQRIGPGAALPRFLLGERFDARTALAIGLVNQVVPDPELDAAVANAVETLLAGSTKAQAAIKKMVARLSKGADPEPVDSYTAQLIASLRASEEGREGVTAFLEKRKPKWLVEPRRDVSGAPAGEGPSD
jgi:methylglutaconyl-CoA hydratase